MTDETPCGDLFGTPIETPLAPGARLLHGYARAVAAEWLEEITRISASAPFRHMQTPGGQAMSVAMTNCGALGWVTDRRGYRYTRDDPLSGQPWPAMPPTFLRLASEAAACAGFDGFAPDACLINRYETGARMGLHQDKDEQDLGHPIVSVSLGLSALFLFGGDRRSDKTQRIPLHHGDVFVWGGPARLRFHSIAPLGAGQHPATGGARINLTFRKAG